jgi:kynurenine formamidase
MNLIDLSHPLEHGQQTFPFDPKLSIVAHGTTKTLKYNITQIVLVLVFMAAISYA